MTDTQTPLFEIDNLISPLQNLLLTFPRPDPLRSKSLSILANARLTRYALSDEGEDLDKSISHSTEAILLPFHTKFASYIIEALFFLAKALLLRSRQLEQPSGVKHAITYLRYLQDQSLETSNVTRSDIKAFFVFALAVQVKPESVDPTRDIGEMATLCHELLKSGVSESLLIHTVKALANAICETDVLFRQPPSDGTIECLREARIQFPDLEQVPFALVNALYSRFAWAHSDDDYEEAMSILDESIADPNGNVDLAMHLAGALAHFRFIRDSKPEHLTEAIVRARTYLNAMSSEDPDRRVAMKNLADLEKRRFEEFGVGSDTLRVLGDLLYRVFHLTGNIDTLHESITVHRDLIKMPGIPVNLNTIALWPINGLLSRFMLFKDRRDGDEIMELFAIAAADTRADAPSRFPTSYQWTQVARYLRHPATLTAYQTSIVLMQESLSFAPTLAIQHFRLVAMRDEYEKLPLDYASYLVQIGQLEQAIETLERGRGLLWSEMRGLRASIDQLRAVNLSLAEKFAAVNRDLEAVTISGSELEDGQAGGCEAMDWVGRLVMKQRKLVEERDKLISQIRAQPGFDTFLIPPSFDTLRSAAAGGPVILINHSKWRSDIIILLHDSPPSLIPTSDDFYDRAKRLHDKLLAARNIGLDSREYECALGYVLEHLYDLVGHPVIERLRKLNVPEQSRIWWCPTSIFSSLPLHAMGPIRSDGHIKLYLSDVYIPSYTPTLSALIESRKPSTQALDTPSMLLVVQPDAQMPSSLQEMRIVRNVCPLVETLFREKATPSSTLEVLSITGKPFDAFFKLYEGTRLTLLDIVRSRLPTAEFAFLSACRTAEITEDSIANEGLHLAAAVQYTGFRSVVGTMWEMADIDGPVVAGSFYKSVFSDKWEGIPYYERTAEALRDAVRDLRKRRT
ncbi:hypothetical protein BJV74DRAFT_988311 [Russula compacta]|nr:hypothetical protein BJV74DRAFT_988311 [Russula compacta]